MGWNSWDCYGTTVTEEEVLANARFLAEHLLPAGWDTVVVDIAWYDPTARAHGYNADAPIVLDALGRQLPDPVRFPSGADGAGFGPLADAVHALGLRFGIHVMRGIPRRAAAQALPIPGTDATTADIADPADVCSWNPDDFGLRLEHPAAQVWLDAQVAQFAAWGVDYLKVDDMLAPYDVAHIEALRRAIDASGREIVLSLSPGTALPLTVAEHVAANADLWRISDDVWDRWEDVAPQFDRLAAWAPVQGRGGWADADMLPLGRIGIRAERGDDRLTRLTQAEQRTLLTLWCIGRSPLMMGGDLPTSPAETIRMLAHPGLMRLHRASRNGRQVLREGDLVVWTAEATDGDATYAAVFHLGDEETRIRVPAVALRAPHAGPATAVDVWDCWDVDPADPLVVPPHGCRLLRFDPT
ncbi:alpha galactosidase A [Amnibacterium kyonggiense]|uniref:Alpha-galactosidase n=2 Tax=Amnibacterium kyonggiense TaxID=595671 RepID=A0A4R7FSB2_9MICO|nr:glycoside hydrolase family 27 protein [Amnibacterium kyonggiense]TDS80628.1 alpha galactosidase A [Amnibacterium kyonggiense]